MNIKKLFIIGTLLLTLPVFTACKPDHQQGGGVDSGSGRPGFEDPNPGAQVPAPAADPGPPNDPKMLRMQVIMTGSERRGKIEMTLVAGGPVITEHTELPKKSKDGKYGVTWIKDITVNPGQHVSFTFFPENPNAKPWSQCFIYHNGQPQDFMQGAQGGNCAASYTVV